MNGIRLAVFALAAFGFLQLDLSQATAQADGYRGPPPGYRDQGKQQQPAQGPPAGADLNGPSGNSRSSRTSRSRRSSRSSSSSNAIKTNPLFKYLDANGDGELSLEEIDAASRLLYALDANEDDAITADEVQDMVADGGGDEGKMMAKDEGDARSARSTRSSSRDSNRTAASGGRAKRGRPQAASGPMGVGGVSPGGLSPGGRSGNNSNVADDDFAGNDKNDDGFITRAEMPRSLRTKFTRMDANGDKEIDEDEWYDYLDNNQ